MREDKLTKGRVHYRPKSERTRQACGNCSMYSEAAPDSGACTLVAGHIDPEYVCDRWEPKR